MEIILIRHTSPNIEKGICYGQTDIDVTDTFLKEVEPILNKVDGINKNTLLYSSPLIRCKKLAQKLSNNIIFDDRLKELNFGDWELKKWNNIPEKELNTWMNDFVNQPAKNGESYIDLHNRTTQFLNEIINKNHTKIIIVTHAGVMRSLYSYINKLPLKNSFDLKLNYGEVLTINYETNN